jgi:hypothetical protein
LTEAKLNEKSQLILYVDRMITFDAKRKAEDIIVSNQNLTISKNKDSDFSNIFGNFELTSGKHYWEIKIE